MPPIFFLKVRLGNDLDFWKEMIAVSNEDKSFCIDGHFLSLDQAPAKVIDLEECKRVRR